MPAESVPDHLVVRAATAARLLDCSRAHVYQLMERGQLRRVQIAGSRAVRIPIADVYAVLGMSPDESGAA